MRGHRLTNARRHRAVGVAGEPSRRPVPAEGGGEKRKRRRWPTRDDRPLHDSRPRWMGEERLRWTGCSSPVPRSPSRSCRRPVRESDCRNLARRSRVIRRSPVNRTHPALGAAFIQRTMGTALSSVWKGYVAGRARRAGGRDRKPPAPQPLCGARDRRPARRLLHSDQLGGHERLYEPGWP